ncbi:MAG: UDP-glucose/GDP-mannose dehydrogenase family protein [Actinomycetota bacterium]|nr:UDP-glucose/GDP-mannose dehydrogenase family protein [Actinomycetota bacterium]
MKVTTIGSGYVGLVTGACLAHIGHEVTGVDIDEAKIARLQTGKIPIFEPGLEDLIAVNMADGRLTFSADVAEGVRSADIIFITVGTPSDENGGADMRYVKVVAKTIAGSLDRYKIIVNKSTVPVGSTILVAKVIQENLSDPREFDVISNPEFLREGSAVEDFMHPDRIVVGTDSQRAAGLMAELYRPLNAPLVITDAASAEMIKYASNCFLATKVSFINAIANICDAVGADVKEVALGMGYDKRIGFEFLRAGPGFGGSCFPKDSRAMIYIAKEHGYDFELLRGVMDINANQKRLIAKKANSLLDGIYNARIGVFGLAFKPNTDDMRDAPALDVIPGVAKRGRTILAYDPVAAANAKELLPEQVQYVDDPFEAVRDADLLLVLTEWDEFRWLDWRRIKDLMKNAVVYDTRNCLDPQNLRRLGFVYQGVGR